MPNWCNTVYKCTGRKKELKDLYEILRKLENNTLPGVKNDFGNLWLGNIVNALGGDWEKVRCRGEVTEFSLNQEKDILIIFQTTAWCEQDDFRKFLEFKYPGIKIFYQEEEPSCDVYYTNDPSGRYFPEKYILASDDVYEYYTRLDSVIKDLETMTGQKYTGPKTPEGIERYIGEISNDDCYYSFHEFKYVED